LRRKRRVLFDAARAMRCRALAQVIDQTSSRVRSVETSGSG
jgi:hypothetical protein